MTLSGTLSHSFWKFSLRWMFSLAPSSRLLSPIPFADHIWHDHHAAPLEIFSEPSKVKITSRNRPVGYVNAVVSLITDGGQNFCLDDEPSRSATGMEMKGTLSCSRRWSGVASWLFTSNLPLEHRWQVYHRYRKAADTLLPIQALRNRRERRQGQQHLIHDIISRSRPPCIRQRFTVSG